MTKLGFGKHGDDELEDVPEKYLKWLITSSQEKIDLCEGELKRRTSIVDNSTMAKIVEAGTKALITTEGEHVDIRAAHAALMRAINDAAGGYK